MPDACLPILFYECYSIKASVKAIKLDSTPLPVLADASKIEMPVLFENSIISSSLTYLYGKSPAASSDFYPLFPESTYLEAFIAYSTISNLFAITMIGMLGAACWSTSLIQLSKLRNDYLSNKSKTRTIPSAPL